MRWMPMILMRPPARRRQNHSVTRVRLTDGARLILRDAHEDAAGLRSFFYGLSDSTRYNYFCAGVPRNEVWAERVAQLGDVSCDTSYALVAEVSDELVGVARFDLSTDTGRAEIGILLTDNWQSRGLGKAVVARLRTEASHRALSGFTATVLGDNRRAIRLLRGAFPQLRTYWSLGQYTLDMPFETEQTLSEPR